MTTPRKMIRTSIIISPEMMGKDWKAHLFEKLNKELVGKCTQEYGYILKVDKIQRVVDQSIMRTGGKIRFTIDFWGETLKPEIGKQLDVGIDMITPHGLFCRFKMLRMLLPLNNCAGYILRQDFSSSCLVNNLKNHVIRKGETIQVKIENVRFENELYSCIVSLLV